MGLSKTGEDTLHTVLLNGTTTPRISTRNLAGKSQLVVEFAPARAGRLPTRLEGDDRLVDQATTEISYQSVRFILDLAPQQPYVYWQKSQPGTAGHTTYFLGLRPEGRPVARPAPSPAAPRPEPQAGAAAAPTAGLPAVRQPQIRPTPPPPREYHPTPAPSAGPTPSASLAATPSPSLAPMAPAVPGAMGEVRQLLPQADQLLQGLEADGWRLQDSRQYDRPGQRFSRDFVLTNARYPELAVNILYLPANAPNTPNIGIVQLSTENLQGEAAAKYREMRQWDFPKIKKQFEDIGDFFDDALKPLRVKLREETKAVALRDAQVFENFLKRLAPGDTQLAAKVMSHVRDKVSPRFEGVQYTESENPLVIINLVDFLNIKAYFLNFS